MARERFEVWTPEPCSQSWDAMAGDSRRRHCAECSKTVHNLARMSRRDVELLAMAVACGEEVCARVTKREDGLLVTLEGGQRAGLRAGLMLSAAMMTGQAVAQSSNEPTAIVSGRLLSLD